MTTTTSAKEWDTIRTAFASSIMVDTALTSLAQSLEGPDWPIKSSSETPAAYIDLSYEEAGELLALKGQPPERLEQLITILRETLAFDDPFGDMVAQSETATERDNPILKNLLKLEIPADHPIEFTALSRETLDFCALEKLTTLGEFAVFAQGMAQNVIVGGDFRGLLNALSHIDEERIAAYLPFRPGSKGLHLIEAVAQAVSLMPVPSGSTLLPAMLTERTARLVHFFSAEASDLRQRIAGGVPLSTVLVVLNQPALEPVVRRLLEPHLPATEPAATAKRPWWSRLFGR